MLKFTLARSPSSHASTSRLNTQLAHLALLDGLMVAFVSSVVTIERVVKAVR